MKCTNCGSKNIRKKGNDQYFCKQCGEKFNTRKFNFKKPVHELQQQFLSSDEKYYWLAYTLFAVLYFITFINAKNKLIVDAYHDDALYYWMAENIVAGKWLGNYMQITLAKVPAYAMFLAGSMKTGIPYMWLLSICNIIATTFLIQKSKYLFGKYKFLVFLLGIFILFNPLIATHLRIYRFQFPAVFMLIFLATIISIFNQKRKKTTLPFFIADALIIVFGWGMLWYSREENLLYLGIIVTSLIAFFLVKKPLSLSFRKVTPMLLGISGVIIFWLFIAGMNHKYYGRFIVNEKNSSPYTDVIKTFNSIADPDFPEYATGSASSRSKIEKIAGAVPYFRPMAKNLVAQALGFRGTYFDKNQLKIVTEDPKALTISHFEWAWISAANATGYHKDAQTLATFYRKLNRQLKQAIKRGKLQQKDDVLLYFGPYALPKSYFKPFFSILSKNYFSIFIRPAEIAKRKNILTQTSKPANRERMKQWSEVLKIKYIEKGDELAARKSRNSLSEKFWNIMIFIWGYIAMSLIHSAVFLALLAFLLSLATKKWAWAAITFILASAYIAHYFMLNLVTVVSSFNATNQAYYLPSYSTALISAFLSIVFIISGIQYFVNKGSNNPA